jgi:hypothetical protein
MNTPDTNMSGSRTRFSIHEKISLMTGPEPAGRIKKEPGAVRFSPAP